MRLTLVIFFGRDNLERIIRLPVRKPIVAHLPQSSAILAILGNKKHEYDWIMANFINIRVGPSWKFDDFYRRDMWYNCYYIQDNSISRDFMQLLYDDVIYFLINLISNGYYAFLTLNRKNIKAYNVDWDTRHPVLIYGYNLETSEFYIADFFSRRHYEFQTASFEEIRQANQYDEREFDWYPFKLQRFFKIKPGYQYRFELNEITTKLIDYYNSEDMDAGSYYQFQTSDMEEKLYFDDFAAYNMQYGLNCYDTAIKLAGEGKLWTRLCYLFFAHKVLMEQRLNYLGEQYGLKEDEALKSMCSELTSECKILYLSVIRNSMYQEHNKKKSDSRARIQEQLIHIKENDKKFTEALVSSLLSST